MRADLLRRARRLFPDKTALVFGESTFSYRELDAAVDGIAARLVGLGVDGGDRVALLFPNHPHLVLGWYAVQRLGAVAVPLAVASSPEQRSSQIADCGARVLLSTAELAASVDKDALADLEQVCVVTDDWTTQDSIETPELAPETPAAILYTSGTTGVQKGVTLSHGALRFNSEATVNALRLIPDDRVLACLPLSHSFSITAAVNTAFEACATLVLLPAFDPERAIEVIEAWRITVFPAVPPVFRVLLDTAEPQPLRSLRTCLSAAIRLPTEIAEGWRQRFGCVIKEGYGTTETSLICFNHPLLYRPGSVGTPLTGIEVAVIGDHGRRCVAGASGEVRVRTGSLMGGYWRRETATADVLCEGWYRTGDIGYLDDDGYLFLTDRCGDVINCGGRKVLPSDVEQVLLTHPSVAEAAVYGDANALLGEEVRAAVVLRTGYPWDSGALVEHCRARLPDWQRPVRIHALDALPKAPSGKLLKRELRARAEAVGLQGIDRDTPDEKVPDAIATDAPLDLEPAIRSAIAAVLGVAPEPEADLREHGLTSMQATQLAVALEAIVGQSLPVTVAFQHPSPVALQRYLEQRLDDGGGQSRQQSLEALSDAALAEAPQIDLYARLPFVHTPYLNTSMHPEFDSEVICTDRHGFRISHDAEGIVDSDSWRNRNHRALALGNSFMWGWGATSDAETIPSLLNARSRYCFLNVAGAGANSFQEVVSALPFLADADLIVLVGGIANLLRSLEYEPYNDLYGGFVGREFHAFVRNLDFRHVLELLEQPDPASPCGRQAAETLRQDMDEHAEGHARWLREGWSEDEVQRRFELAISHQRRDLDLLVRAKRPGARILYAMQPTTILAKPELTLQEHALIAVHQHYNTMWRQVFEPYVKDLLPDYIAAVADNCAALGVPFVDLNRLDYEGWCFCDQGHALDRGNRIVADCLADRLDRSGFEK